MSFINKIPQILSIAGSDSSGGAGIQADIKTITALHGYAATVITALTAQNTQGVQAIHEIPAGFVTQQLDAVFQDLNIIAVKVGMLANEDIIRAVATSLAHYQPRYVVIDPVMVATTGCELLTPTAHTMLTQALFPLAHLITPNIPEAEKLLGIAIKHEQAMEAAARALGELYQTAILIKGGHLNQPLARDVLYQPTHQQCGWFTTPRINTLNTHGTGCTLSAAIATLLAFNLDLVQAITTAKNYLQEALTFGTQLQIGKGHGPVDHSYQLRRNTS